MAKITYTNKTKATTFADIQEGEFFMFRECLYQKTEEIFKAEEIRNEIEYEHDLQGEDEIVTQVMNCYDYSNNTWDTLSDLTVVVKVDVEIVVSEVK